MEEYLASIRKDHYILIMDENVTFEYDGTIEDCTNTILEEYERHDDLSMNELLDKIEIVGLSINNVSRIRTKLLQEDSNE